MKKNLNLVFVFVLALSMLFGFTTGSVSASPNPFAPNANLAGGTWSAGTEVELNLDASKYPGLQLLTNGVVITQPTKLCHEFRGGDYGWVADIRMLKKGIWVKQPTTSGWVPDTKGVYTACTDASAAGTYALFGWFDPTSPKIHKNNLPLCDKDLLVSSGYMTFKNSGFFTTSFTFLIPDMQKTPMTLSIVKALDKSDNPLNYDASSFGASDSTDETGGLSLVYLISENEPGYYHVTLTTPTCYFDIDPLKKIY